MIWKIFDEEMRGKKQANKLLGCCPACVEYLEYAEPCVGINSNGVSFHPAHWGEFAIFQRGFLGKGRPQLCSRCSTTKAPRAVEGTTMTTLLILWKTPSNCPAAQRWPLLTTFCEKKDNRS